LKGFEKNSFVSVNFTDHIIYPETIKEVERMGIYREENVIEKAKVRLDAEIYRRNVFVKCYTLETPFEPRTGKVVYASLFVFHMSSAFQEVQRYMEAGILGMLTKMEIWQDSKLTKKPWETGQREFHAGKFAWDSKIMVGLVVYTIGVLTFIIFLIGEWIYILVFKIDN
jgi:hypothetical protein